jgi:hypothetical protein
MGALEVVEPEPVAARAEPAPLKPVEAVEEVHDRLSELDDLPWADEIEEEATELRPRAPSPRPDASPVSLSREPMSVTRRVLVALTLLVLFAAVAVALRTVG